ncbi:hypothetical protein [Saccharothrix coeruleofusca]|uniref:Uncharacterized protein n=1 Tax=Saccharothrix coeruleofusca TaxID=33919 RepID=A0A918EFB6_9PSEU|nr:hypothetical protein [Saccharothrix coeruleofusca]MBP2340793.1 hypothetical protein [Saccharothrix coeruleofusca]GGP59871.1 hypothetical protein GCM10010185_35330 [Saccharothrix coeruleofusca]
MSGAFWVLLVIGAATGVAVASVIVPLLLARRRRTRMYAELREEIERLRTLRQPVHAVSSDGHAEAGASPRASDAPVSAPPEPPRRTVRIELAGGKHRPENVAARVWLASAA